MERIFHTWDEWECYPSGFYEVRGPNGMTTDECEETYRNLLSDAGDFSDALGGVILEWKNSCEHYLTNESMNRIAWLGQAALCYKYGIPSRFRGGYNMLTEAEKENADKIALKYLNKWLVSNGYDAVTEEEAGKKAKVNLY